MRHSSLLLALLLATSLAGCSSDGDDEGSASSGAAASCEALCAAQKAGCAEYDLQACKGMCGVIPEGCQDEVDAYRNCVGTAWICSTTSTFNDGPQAEQEDATACSDEAQAYSGCFFGG